VDEQTADTADPASASSGVPSPAVTIPAVTCTAQGTMPQSEKQCVEKSQSYWQQMWMLCTETRFASFRSYVFVLGISTSALYVYPLLANNALVNAGITTTTATLLILMVTVPNILVRAAMLIRPVCKDTMVWIGMVLQLLGAFAMLAAVLVAEMTVAGDDQKTAIMVVILPGILVSAGVGACQPNCKSGAMLDVSDEMSATAASLLKLLQLLWVALMQAVAGAMAGDATTAVRNQSILLSGVCTLGLVWLAARRSATSQKYEQAAATTAIDTAGGVQVGSATCGNSALGEEIV